jgi:hypothetical protein
VGLPRVVEENESCPTGWLVSLGYLLGHCDVLSKTVEDIVNNEDVLAGLLFLEALLVCRFPVDHTKGDCCLLIYDDCIEENGRTRGYFRVVSNLTKSLEGHRRSVGYFPHGMDINGGGAHELI